VTTRRSVLAGVGTVAMAGLAGCSELPFGDRDQTRPDVSLPADVAGDVEWPASPFPVAVPDSLPANHEDRARELLADVPESPSVPNEGVAADLGSDRAEAAGSLSDDVEEPWPGGRLSEWRSRRESAATVRGAYRAATGENDAEAVEERRRAVRTDLAGLVADHEYRAASPLEAVLVHEPMEELLADCRRRVRPRRGYPADPVARPFRAGEAVARAEDAQATLADARGLREAYLTSRDDAPSQWSALIDASDRLRLAVGRTQSAVDDFLDVSEPPFDADLQGTAGRELFETGRGQVEWTTEEFSKRRREGDYATGIVEAARSLAAIEAFRAAIEGIQDGGYQDEVTVETVRRTGQRAREAIDAARGSEHQAFVNRLLESPLGIVDGVAEQIERGFGDAPRIQGSLAWAELFARAVPPATAFTVERLA
jgi:hypothetical protein